MQIEAKNAVWSAGLLLALGCVVLTGCEQPQAAGLDYYPIGRRQP